MGTALMSPCLRSSTQGFILSALPLRAGVKWFEIDRADVLRAKRETLEAAGASFEHDAAPDPTSDARVLPVQVSLNLFMCVRVCVGGGGAGCV